MSNLPAKNNPDREITPQERERILALREEEVRNKKKELALREQELENRKSRNRTFLFTAIIGFFAIAIVAIVVAIVFIYQNKTPEDNQVLATSPSVQNTNEALVLTIQALSALQTQAAVVVTSTKVVSPTQVSSVTPNPTPIPTSIPTVPPTVQPVALPEFYDNFDKGFADQWRPVAGNWITEDGTAVPQTKGGSVIVVGDPTWDNFALEMDFKTPEYENYTRGDMKVLLGYKDTKNFVVLEFCGLSNNKGYVNFWSYENGKRTDLMNTLYDAYSLNETHHLRIEIRSKKADIFLDGAALKSFGLANSLKGPVGLFGSPVAKPIVDNFKVSPLK